MNLTVADTGKVPEVVSRTFSSSRQFDEENQLSYGFDVLVCGGTLGIFVATALISKGLRVGIVERNLLKGVLSYSLCYFMTC